MLLSSKAKIMSFEILTYILRIAEHTNPSIRDINFSPPIPFTQQPFVLSYLYT